MWSFEHVAGRFEDFLCGQRAHLVDRVLDEVITPLPVVADGAGDGDVLRLLEDDVEDVGASVFLDLELHDALHDGRLGAGHAHCPGLTASVLFRDFQGEWSYREERFDNLVVFSIFNLNITISTKGSHSGK